jgi:methylated-DNA-protein-cysteine methyltransferase related protein
MAWPAGAGAYPGRMPATAAHREPEGAPTDPAAYIEAVLDLVDAIPPGRVMSYGAIAEHLYQRYGRGSARRVGTIMAWYGGPVPWHRVVNSLGRLPPRHEREARRRLEAEGVVFRGTRVPMARYSWSPQ